MRSSSFAHRLPALAVLLVLALSLTACSMRTGTTEVDAEWQQRADQTLGTAISSLGTAQVLLENQVRGRLTRSYVVVGVRDTLTALSKGTEAFLSLQPPAGLRAAHADVVAALQDALATLDRASIAATDGSDDDRSAVLEDVRQAYGEVEDAQARAEEAAR